MGYTFAASQAWQFAAVEARYPDLFERVSAMVKKKQFVPVGGSWVEFDCNMPSGESLCRQLLLGCTYFTEKFGQAPSVFWLPDTFGYSAQLPQLLRQCGQRFFLTQKLSWNLVNKFPHTTFRWEGLDGTSVITHCPPADTYSASATVEEVHKSVTNHKDKDRSPTCVVRALCFLGVFTHDEPLPQRALADWTRRWRWRADHRHARTHATSCLRCRGPATRAVQLS